MRTEMLNEVRQNSGWFIALGVLMIVLGIAAIVEPLMATIAFARVLSWVFLFAGIIRTIHAVQSRRQPGFWPKLIIGILYVLTGILLLGNILGAALTLTLVFGWVILAQGVLEVIAAFKSRPEPGWVWTLISGILAIILGILILYQWPIGAAWLLGVFVGINLLFTGVSMILITSGLRRFRLGAEV